MVRLICSTISNSPKYAASVSFLLLAASLTGVIAGTFAKPETTNTLSTTPRLMRCIAQGKGRG